MKTHLSNFPCCQGVDLGPIKLTHPGLGLGSKEAGAAESTLVRLAATVTTVSNFWTHGSWRFHQQHLGGVKKRLRGGGEWSKGLWDSPLHQGDVIIVYGLLQ